MSNGSNRSTERGLLRSNFIENKRNQFINVSYYLLAVNVLQFFMHNNWRDKKVLIDYELLKFVAQNVLFPPPSID